MVYQTVGKAFKLETETNSLQDLMALARRGLAKKAIDSLAQVLDISSKELIQYLNISELTLQRYDDDKILPKEVSSNLIQIAKIYALALDIFDDKETAIAWLKHPNQALGGITPLSCLDNPFGAEFVADILRRVYYGIFA